MGCYRISEKAKDLRKKYLEKFGYLPRGMYYQEGETIKQYEEYLEKALTNK